VSEKQRESEKGGWGADDQSKLTIYRKLTLTPNSSDTSRKLESKGMGTKQLRTHKAQN